MAGSVDGDAAGAAQIGDAHLARGEEQFGADVLAVAERQRRAERNGAAQDHAVDMGVDEDDFAGSKQILHEELGPQPVRVHGRDVGRRGAVDHAHHAASVISPRSSAASARHRIASACP